MPKMLTMDERFEAIVADVALTSEAKMRPLHEQDPERGTPDETEGAPEKREPAEAPEAKMGPLREPDPERRLPDETEDGPEEREPAEEK